MRVESQSVHSLVTGEVVIVKMSVSVTHSQSDLFTMIDCWNELKERVESSTSVASSTQ